MARRLYCAVIGDINKSRLIADREKAQTLFERSVRAMNREFAPHILSRVTITRGDEVQVLLRDCGETYRFVLRLQELMEPFQLSFGVGCGTLATALRSSPLSMDGEVFHRARRALDESKHRRSFVRFALSRSEDELLNALAALLHANWARLTLRQREIARLTRSGLGQTPIARKLGVTQPTIWKALTARGIREMCEAERALGMLLARAKGRASL